MRPSIWPSARGSVENSTVFTLIELASRLPAFKKAFQIGRLVSEIPIVLPIMSLGVRMGLLSLDTMQVGIFWNAAPITCSPAPFTMASQPSWV